jgi:hypothetical protein
MWLKSACSVIIPASTDLASIPDYAPAGSGSHRTAAGSNQTSRGDAAGRVTAEGSAAGQNRLDRCPSNLIVAARACKLHERDAGAREYRPRSVPREPLGEFPSALNAPAPHHDRVWWPGCRVAWIDRHRPVKDHSPLVPTARDSRPPPDVFFSTHRRSVPASFGRVRSLRRPRSLHLVSCWTWYRNRFHRRQWRALRGVS